MGPSQKGANRLIFAAPTFLTNVSVNSLWCTNRWFRQLNWLQRTQLQIKVAALPLFTSMMTRIDTLVLDITDAPPLASIDDQRSMPSSYLGNLKALKILTRYRVSAADANAQREWLRLFVTPYINDLDSLDVPAYLFEEFRPILSLQSLKVDVRSYTGQKIDFAALNQQFPNITELSTHLEWGVYDNTPEISRYLSYEALPRLRAVDPGFFGIFSDAALGIWPWGKLSLLVKARLDYTDGVVQLSKIDAVAFEDIRNRDPSIQHTALHHVFVKDGSPVGAAIFAKLLVGNRRNPAAIEEFLSLPGFWRGDEATAKTLNTICRNGSRLEEIYAAQRRLGLLCTK
jgi:hypothetical protein